MKWWFSSWNLSLFSLSKVCKISSADCFISGFTASQSPQLRLRSIVGYTLFNNLSFAPHSPQSFLPLRRAVLIVICHCLTSWKTTKKAADNFFYHRLKTQVLSFYFRYIKHLRLVSVDKKIRAISFAFLGAFFARILIPIIKFVVDFI